LLNAPTIGCGVPGVVNGLLNEQCAEELDRQIKCFH
jgi:hypothetical protein